MTSDELARLKQKYLSFKESLENMLTICSRAIEEIDGTGTLLNDGYSIDGEPIDDGYIHKSESTMELARESFRKTIGMVVDKINSLDKEIEIARDKELAELIAARGGAE